ncbi:ParB/RepB/Spo0J family partition protein [Actinomadura darangshiensis]|uniref:ParB/RepB/Spo0J family partition protein n=1 Tax=Actinomadura darangshiensis TaxID=705336 RepID=A0A4V2YVX1_9ACTN|nr:ParB/RepB/Spo0J family partition protein [Actinomadura darangshiensis]TDD83157.1 ParB/RepB/Spo0J family partition protein [Actinomadura darangshiensis]
MAAIRAIREVLVKGLVFGEGQARIRGADKEIEELAESIRRHGMLEPIVVCPSARDPQKLEVLMGQRRVQAHRILGRRTILAAIIDRPVDLTTARVLSLTENLLRVDLDTRDIIDGCTTLYRKYGSARMVAEETGLPYNTVRKHVKYDRLTTELQEMVDSGEVVLDVALKVQDVADTDVPLEPDEVKLLAREMSEMTAAQRRTVIKAKQESPETPVESLLKEHASPKKKVKQIIVTLSPDEHQALQAYAKQRKVTQDKAAHILISDALELMLEEKLSA